LELPTDCPRPSQPSSAGRTLFRTLPESLSAALRQFSHQEQNTLFVTLLAAFKVLLYRYTGQDDLVVGTAVAQRNRTELEPLVGFFANTVALRTRLSGNLTFRQLLQRVQHVTGEALAHQDLPFEQVVQLLSIARRPNQPSWLQVMFVLHNASEDGLRLPGLEVSRLPVDPGTAKFDLTLIAVDQPAGLEFWIEYRSDLFHQDTIEQLYQQLQVLLQAILDRPQISLQTLLLLIHDEIGKSGALDWPNRPNASPAIELNQSDVYDTHIELRADARELRLGTATYGARSRQTRALRGVLRARSERHGAMDREP
jgi:non-ribosomal peptide synthetase component F